MNNWIDSIYLVSYEEEKDSDGFIIKTENISDEIPANFKSVTRAEEEHSKIMGYNAELMVEVMKCNYNQEPILIDARTNKKYSIRRTYEVTSELIQLTCSDLTK